MQPMRRAWRKYLKSIKHPKLFKFGVALQALSVLLFFLPVGEFWWITVLVGIFMGEMSK